MKQKENMYIYTVDICLAEGSKNKTAGDEHSDEASNKKKVKVSQFFKTLRCVRNGIVYIMYCNNITLVE